MAERMTALPSASDRWVAFGALAVVLIIFGSILYKMFTGAGTNPAPPAVRVIFSVIALLVIGIAASLFWSYTELGANEVTFRQGLYFKATIPYANIESAKAVEAPGGIWVPGVRQESGGKGVRIVLSPRNLVEVRLRNPIRIVVFGLIPIANVERILFNAPFPERVAETLMSRSR